MFAAYAKMHNLYRVIT